jgi:AcrR family transcriptional regulator
VSVTAAAAAATSTSAPELDEQRERAVGALLRCVARYGLAKTTLDDVAREAGCSRATLYRWVESKPELLRLTVATEKARVLGLVLAAAEGCDSFGDAVVATVTTSAREVAGHDALRFLLSHEPATVRGHLAFAAGEALTGRVAAATAPAFARWLAPDDARRAADWLVRVVRSYSLTPTPAVDLADESVARPFLEQFVIPGLAGMRKWSHDDQ